ncbi:OmpA family protein [Aequorivita capsosiphonis]|uniref:OmpA family protein n=1 Tax=Aequorivita capsosiphonis TaxID=487317 RepID=UPI0004795D34|nr:OmpA family protein [Aequorivita capsosiphonis]
MNKIYTILLLIAVSTSMITAQNRNTKKADQYYDRLQYTDATAAYEKLLNEGEKNTYVYVRLANSYYFINDTKNAERFYEKAINDEGITSETVYNYAQSLKANGKFEMYNKWMKIFASMIPSDSRAMAFMENPNYLPKIMDSTAQRYFVTNLTELNSKFSDFGGTAFQNELYFSSARNETGKVYGWNEEPYLEIYTATINADGSVKNAKLLKGDVNTKYHESTVAITPDGKRMYFDRNDYYGGKYKKNSAGINQLNIYYAENVNGAWKDIKSVSFNDNEYSNSHPALSPDGKTLYYTSNRPGGIGNSDIYKVSVNEDGSFGVPENLGEPVNTEGDEGFPYVDSDGTLYFSSNGHLGMGGLDVFAAKATDDGFGKPKNLGIGANSSADDFAFTYNPETKQGYVSSDRAGGKGSDDIYKIGKSDLCNLNVLVVDANTDMPISGSRIELYDEFENKLKSQTTETDGTTVLTVDCSQNHVVQAFMEGYESNSETVSSSEDDELNVRIALRPIGEIVDGNTVKLNPILFDFDKHNIKPQAAFELDKLVELMKKNPEMIIKVESFTDNRGSDSYNLGLSDRRAKSTVQYVISKGIAKDRISGKGFGENNPAVDCGANCTEAQHQENRRSEFTVMNK